MNTKITLKTLPDATAQQVFDHIARHLLTQNARSERYNKCLYRHPNGLKCAAGSIIADDEYNPSFEKKCWYTLLKLRKVPEAHSFLIDTMQEVHDASFPEEWPARLEAVATNFELDQHVIKEFNGHGR